MMTHFRFGPEVVVETWFTPHSTQNHRLSDEKNRNYTLKMLTSGFMAKKPIQSEVVLETWSSGPFQRAIIHKILYCRSGESYITLKKNHVLALNFCFEDDKISLLRSSGTLAQSAEISLGLAKR